MLRLSSRLHGLQSRKKIAALLNQKCHQSTRSGGSKGATNIAIISAAGITTVGAGIVGYSAWSNENRKFVEETIPGSSVVLETVLGPVIEPLPAPAVVTPKTDVGLLQKKLEREKKVEGTLKDTTKKVQEPTPSSIPPLPPIQEPLGKTKDAPPELKEQPSPVSAADTAARLAASEKAEVKENAALAQLLENSMKSAKLCMTEARNAAENAASAVRKYAEKAYAAIDSGEGDDRLFAVAAEVARVKKESIKAAEEKLTAARSKIEELKSTIESGRHSVLTKENPTLTVAEEALSELKYSASRISSVVLEALRDSTAISELKDVIEAGRKQFEAEVRSLMPDVKLGEKSEKLTMEELNLLLAHAHRKVMALQKALAKQQTVDKEHFKESVLRQRERETHLLDGRLQAELERQKRDLGTDHRHHLNQLREEMEAELRMQLKRQAAAHSDHLSDVLAVQEKDLERKWESKLHEEVQAESSKYYKALSSVQGDLYGLKAAIKSRADADKAAYAAHELWLSCESLRTALRLGKEEARSWEEQLLPLQKQMKTIKEAAGDKNPFIEVVLHSIPEKAISRGVYTEDALKERFIKVDRVCRRVALVGENGGSLIRYLLSYVQSFFLLNAFEQIPGNELRDEKVDMSRLDTHDILARVRYCLAKDDLVQAVRYMNLLRGEPHIVASDWVKEARMTLEAKQAAEALMAYAAATGTRAL